MITVVAFVQFFRPSAPKNRSQFYIILKGPSKDEQILQFGIKMQKNYYRLLPFILRRYNSFLLDLEATTFNENHYHFHAFVLTVIDVKKRGRPLTWCDVSIFFGFLKV